MFASIFCINSSAERGIKIAVCLADEKMIENGTLLQDRYLIERQIGAGGMGAVYLAVDRRFGSYVAIKETFYKNDALGEAFEREAHLLNSLLHPVLPHVSDFFTETGGHFLVMQFIEGEDLFEVLNREGAFPMRNVLRWTDSLLDALDYLHSHEPPVIHRDIKPQNLKITPRGDVILLDFGLAKLNSDDTQAQLSVFGYSRKYSPLEQIQGTGTDARSDLFALAATTYHLLTGKPPLDALTRASAIVAGNADPLPLASEVNAKIPTGVASVLNSALSLNPAQRFISANAMRQALEHALSTDSTQDADELFEPVLAAAVPAAEVIVNSAETENFPALEAFTDKVKNLLEADMVANLPAIPAEPVDKTVMVIPFADKINSLFETDVTQNIADIKVQPEKIEAHESNLDRAMVENASVQPNKQETASPAAEILHQHTSVSEVVTTVLPRKKTSRLPLTALAAAAVIFVGLAAGYFMNKASSSAESIQNPVIQPLHESDTNIEQPATITSLPASEVSEPPLSQNIEQTKVEPASMKTTTVEKRAAAIEKRKTVDESLIQTETTENIKPAPPAKIETSPVATSRKQAPRRNKSQPSNETRSRVVESQSAPDIESIFTGRPTGGGSDGQQRREERRQQREQMSDEELREVSRQRRKERRQRQNNQPFPF